MGGNGSAVGHEPKPVLLSPPAAHGRSPENEFQDGKLHPPWRWSAKHRAEWFSPTVHPGVLRLYPQIANPSLKKQPNLLLRKAPSRGFVVETLLEFYPCQWSEEAGLVLMGRTCAALALRHDGLRNMVVLRINDAIKVIGPVSAHTAKLQMQMTNDGMCSFEVGTAGRTLAIPDHLQAAKGRGIVTRIGLYSIKRLEHSFSGCADFAGFKLRDR